SSAPAGRLSWGGLGLVVLFRYTTSNFSRRRAIDLMWRFPLNRIRHDAVVLADCGADDLGCFGISGFICGISALDQDNQLLGVIDFDGKCRDGVRAYVIGSLLDGAFNILRVVVAARDDNQVLQTAGDIQLPIDDGAQISGCHPLIIIRCTLYTAACCQALAQGITEGVLGVVFAA